MVKFYNICTLTNNFQKVLKRQKINENFELKKFDLLGEAFLRKQLYKIVSLTICHKKLI